MSEHCTQCKLSVDEAGKEIMRGCVGSQPVKEVFRKYFVTVHTVVRYHSPNKEDKGH